MKVPRWGIIGLIWRRLGNSRRLAGDATLGRCQAGLDSPWGRTGRQKHGVVRFSLLVSVNYGSGLHCRRMDPRTPAPGFVWYPAAEPRDTTIFGGVCTHPPRMRRELRGYLKVMDRGSRFGAAPRPWGVHECWKRLQSAGRMSDTPTWNI